MRIIKTVRDKKYVYFRDYDTKAKKQVDVSCGREDVLASEQKYTSFEQRSIRSKIADHKHKLADMTDAYAEIETDGILPLDAVINKDALETMMNIPSNSIHMAVTSPPYNVGLEYWSGPYRMRTIFVIFYSHFSPPSSCLFLY